jgi:hypothetical protein
MVAYEEVKVSLNSFLTFPLDVVNDQLHARITTTGNWATGIHWTGELMDHRADMDALLWK